ncbi:MAG: hypothetical protein ACRDTW_09455, partial [Rhodococcus qingshengii]
PSAPVRRFGSYRYRNGAQSYLGAYLGATDVLPVFTGVVGDRPDRISDPVSDSSCDLRTI